MTRHYYTADGRHWVLMEIDETVRESVFERVTQWLTGSLAATKRFYAYPKRK